jgi:hypothetical protein
MGGLPLAAIWECYERLGCKLGNVGLGRKISTHPAISPLHNFAIVKSFTALSYSNKSAKVLQKIAESASAIMLLVLTSAHL